MNRFPPRAFAHRGEAKYEYIPLRQHNQPTTVEPTIAEEDIYQEDAPTDFGWIPDDHPHVGQADIEGTAAADHGACDSDDYNGDSKDADESDGAGGAATSYGLAFDPQHASLYFHHLPNSAVERCSDEAACPRCGSAGCRGGLSPIPVTVVCWDKPMAISLPQLTCMHCRAPFTIRSTTAVDCLPDTVSS
ncbi:hypothetical protein VOLCADRAFT_99545 [Volvox carteri f. nagariensis]|uniref:Uncharacterized protein n=1 Tax=Volvox carteri f. nagariensis TaxID=3068 RepID=D8UI11_VOLCA|nr:uncharacterized protein VOLCADRAFT_99545 [Volvox carteri f. nagariensis]EFJ40656.1 hypothetical protein VOLCADRAFT_99545 [Volvox carteri f. nagariensis]|eukprot:XP_002958282.1 hypothetical protein VOLCADRAFT_99545 [Volvox carteri f. nagariensis]